MDIADFLERFADTKLPEWQKEYIMMLYEIHRKNPDKRIYINVRPYQDHDAFYTYFKEYALKELTQDGATLNCN